MSGFSTGASLSTVTFVDDTTGGFTPSLTLSCAPTTRSSLQFTVGVSVVMPV